MAKYKKPLEPGSYLTPADMLTVLSQQRLTAAAVAGCIVLAADEAMAWLLDGCCVGRPWAAEVQHTQPSMQQEHSPGNPYVNNSSQRNESSGGANGSSIGSNGGALHGSNGAAAGASTGAGIGMLCAVLAAAGGNAAGPGVWQQYQAHVAELQARQQQQRRRKTRAAGGPAATTATAAVLAVAAPAAGGGSAIVRRCPDHQQLRQEGQEQQQEQQEQQQQKQVQQEQGQHECMQQLEQEQERQERDGDAGAGPCNDSGSWWPAAAQVWQLVHLNFQEAVFLGNVLHCCDVYAAHGVATATAAAAGEQEHPGQQHGTGCSCLGAEQACSTGTHHTTMRDTEHQQQQEQQGQHEHHQQQQVVGAVQQAPMQQPLSPAELWRWCCEYSTGGAAVFAGQYSAYHHLRCLGWLPMPGLTFGGDYVLYQLHPEFAHSDFVVTVMLEQQPRHSLSHEGTSAVGHAAHAAPDAAAAPAVVGSRSGGQCVASAEALAACAGKQGYHQKQQQQQQDAVDGDAGRSSSSSTASTQLTWLDACIMQRLARQVLKHMLLLYVVMPPDVQLHDPCCVQQLQVREVWVQRWVPAEHREQGNE